MRSATGNVRLLRTFPITLHMRNESCELLDIIQCVMRLLAVSFFMVVHCCVQMIILTAGYLLQGQNN